MAISRVCFSYAAYAKKLIFYLRSLGIPVDPGLTESEFSAVESSLGFAFPPDLRAILQEGLPVGPGFVDWRSSSKQHLENLTGIPVSGIRKEVSGGFWVKCWGERPDETDRAVERAEGFLRKAPILVPMYRDFYIPSAPCAAGNPVFWMRGGDVRVRSFDIAGFFRSFEIGEGLSGELGFFAAPAWTATEARRIEFWSEVAGEGTAAGWWGGDLSGCMEGVFWRLRNGGWGEEDVREMMSMDGWDEFDNQSFVELLLCAGRSRDDVVESSEVLDGEWLFEVDCNL